MGVPQISASSRPWFAQCSALPTSTRSEGPADAGPLIVSGAAALLLELRVDVERHRLVVEVAVQAQLIHEVRIEGEASGRDEADEAALAEREDVLARHLRPPRDDDLPVRRAVRLRDRGE